MNILDNQISAQLEGRTDIALEFADTTKKGKIKLYSQKKGRTTLHWAQYYSLHHISKAEYDELIEIAQSDVFGNLTIQSDNEQEFKNKYYEQRPNVILEKIGKALFGNSWKKALAENLDVDERRITHWLQCSRPIPKTIFSDLAKVKNKRLREIQDIEKYLSA